MRPVPGNISSKKFELECVNEIDAASQNVKNANEYNAPVFEQQQLQPILAWCHR